MSDVPGPAALDAKVLLSVLAQVREGDFTVRMPLDWTGVAGKVADGLNDVIIANQALEAELDRVSRVVGKQGELSQRVALRGATQSWSGKRRIGEQPDRLAGAAHGRDAARDRRGGRRRPEQEDLPRRPRRDAGPEEHHQRDGRPAQRVRVRADASGPRGRHGGQARSGRGGDDRGRRRLEGPDRQREPDGRQPDRPGPEHRRGDHRGGQRRPEQEDLDRREGRVPGAQEHRQRDGRPAERVRRRGHASGARGGSGGQAGRPGAVEGGGGRLEGPHRQRQPARRQPDQPGASDRGGGHRGHRGRPHPAGPGGGERRGGHPQGHAQRDDPQPPRDDPRERRAGLAEDQPRALHPHASGPARPLGGVEHDPLGARAARVGAARGLLLDDQAAGRRRARAPVRGRLRLRGAQAPGGFLPARGGPHRAVRQGEEADPGHRGAR